MKDIVKHYTNGEITVVWKPDLCFHSGKCWNGLGEVFNPKKRPWIELDDVQSQRIVDQVNQCPSKALSYFCNSERPEGAEATAETTTRAPYQKVEEKVAVGIVIEAMPNGPLLVHGEVTVKDSRGNEYHKQETTAFCRCGNSQNKPFCDGSHARVGFKDE